MNVFDIPPPPFYIPPPRIDVQNERYASPTDHSSLKPSENDQALCKDPQPAINHADRSSSSQSNAYLQILNKEMRVFLEKMQLRQKQESSDHLTSDLGNLALHLQNCYSEMIVKGTIPTEQMDAVIQSTYFDCEISISSSEISPPQSLLTMIFLLKFLQQLEQKSQEETRLLTIVKSCLELLSILKIAGSYCKGYEDFARKLVVASIVEKINKIQVGETIGIPGGWINQPKVEGHFILYALRRLNQDQYEIVRFNTHQAEKGDHSKKSALPYEKGFLSDREILGFATNTVDLYIPQSLASRLKEVSPETQSLFLFNINRRGILNPQIESRIVFDLQKRSFNCCFMSFFILFQYFSLCLDEEHGCLYNKALVFRSKFQQFLFA